MTWLDPRQWLLALLFALVGAVGIQFWTARLVAEGDAEGYARAKAEYTAAALAAEVKVRADTARMQKEKDDAETEAAQRLVLQKRDNHRLGLERDGLRNELEDARERLRVAPVEAVRKYAATAQDVFEQCVRRYSDLAQAADGHSSDTLKLLKAWPTL